jgi:hypothetical protein
MSLQNYLEDLVGDLVTAAIPAFVVVLGPISQPRAEGGTRVASIRHVGGVATRLEYAMTDWTESVLVTFFWSATIARETAATELDQFRNLVMITPELVLTGDPLEGIRDGYIASVAWGEAVDGHFRTASVSVTIERVA